VAQVKCVAWEVEFGRYKNVCRKSIAVREGLKRYPKHGKHVGMEIKIWMA
jgi:hypothetical protein